MNKVLSPCCSKIIFCLIWIRENRSSMLKKHQHKCPSYININRAYIIWYTRRHLCVSRFSISFFLVSIFWWLPYPLFKKHGLKCLFYFQKNVPGSFLINSYNTVWRKTYYFISGMMTLKKIIFEFFTDGFIIFANLATNYCCRGQLCPKLNDLYSTTFAN